MSTQLPYGHTTSIARLNALVGADLARDLLKVSIDDQRGGPIDVSAAPIEANPQNVDVAAASSKSVQKDDDTTEKLEAPGANTLEVRVDRAKKYSVTVTWQDQDYNDLFTDTILSNVSGEQTEQIPTGGPVADVTIKDQSSADSTASYSLTLTPVADLEADEPLDVSGGTVPVEQQTPVQLEDSGGTGIDPATESTLSNTLSREIATWSAGTIPTDPSSRQGRNLGKARLMDSSGVLIEPDQAPNYPDNSSEQDLIGTGDLTVGPVSVARSEQVIISGYSEDSNSWSASVTWTDGNGNTVSTESATDIGLSSVTDASAQIARKGSHVEVTFTDESSGSANNINAYVDVSR